jgi:hypothetical protein
MITVLPMLECFNLNNPASMERSKVNYLRDEPDHKYKEEPRLTKLQIKADWNYDLGL